MRNVFAIVLASALLAACGQKGALYLPDEQREDVPPSTPAAPVASPIPAPAPGPASTDEGENNARRNRNN